MQFVVKSDTITYGKITDRSDITFDDEECGIRFRTLLMEIKDPQLRLTYYSKLLELYKYYNTDTHFKNAGLHIYMYNKSDLPKTNRNYNIALYLRKYEDYITEKYIVSLYQKYDLIKRVKTIKIRGYITIEDYHGLIKTYPYVENISCRIYNDPIHTEKLNDFEKILPGTLINIGYIKNNILYDAVLHYGHDIYLDTEMLEYNREKIKK